MRIWLFAAKRRLFVRIKFVILLPISMTGLLIMATAMCKTVRSALPTIVWDPSPIHCPMSPRAAEVHNNVMIHNDIMMIYKVAKQIPAVSVALSILCAG